MRTEGTVITREQRGTIKSLADAEPNVYAAVLREVKGYFYLQTAHALIICTYDHERT